MSEFLFPIQSSHLLFFARAIGDPDADDTDFSTAIAPPTFGIAHHQFRPGYPLRPQSGQPWIGSGRTDSGADASGFEAALHAEQQFDYFRPISAGMTLAVDTVTGSSWTKARRDNGHLAFSESVTHLRDAATGELVQTARSVGVVIRPGPPPGDSPGGPADVTGPADGATVGPVGGPAGGRIALPDLGERRELIVFDGLTRTQLVLYAGASGDYNPLHTDEIFATRVAGYPSVFAHGMLTMGASARVLTEWVDPRLLRSYRVQFRGQVWPGDTLTVAANVEARGEESAAVTLATTTQDGRLVLSGSAVLGPPPGREG